jgi:hypothetical protein
MIGSFVSNIKSRLTSRVTDDGSSSVRATDGFKNKTIFNKLLNASYSLVSQTQDDAFSNENFMLPRVYSQSSELCRSPISLKPEEKSFDELENIVDKFVRCISLEHERDVYVHTYYFIFHLFDFMLIYW